MRMILKSIAIAIVVGTFAVTGMAEAASWVGSGWKAPDGVRRVFPLNGKSAEYWPNWGFLQITRSRNLTNATPHWAASECTGGGLPTQMAIASTWSGAAGPQLNTTPLCPLGQFVNRGGTFIFN
jgi:hypothetical protein